MMKKILMSLIVITVLSAAVVNAGELEIENLELDQEFMNSESVVNVNFDVVVTPPVFQSSIGIMIVDPNGAEELICSSYSPPGMSSGTYSIGHSETFEEGSLEGEWSFTAMLWQADGCPTRLNPDDSESVSINYDRTAPSISLNINSAMLMLNEQSAVIEIEDGISGSGIDWERTLIIGAVEDADGNWILDTTTPGMHVAILHIYDNAGNESWATYEYDVQFEIAGAGTDGAFLVNADSNSDSIDGIEVDGVYQPDQDIELIFGVADFYAESVTNTFASMQVVAANGDVVADQVLAIYDSESETYMISFDASDLEAGFYELQISVGTGQQFSLLIGINEQVSAAGGGGTSSFTFSSN